MGHPILIRKYRESDCEQVQKICIATATGPFAQNEAFRLLLLTTFCNYYIEQEPENCFVADNGQGAVGYILCAEDANTWSGTFQEKYINNLPDENLKLFCLGTMNSPLKFSSEYPAHLHIDILPEYQRKGIGTMLMDALVKHLRDKGIHGLMLSVAADNVKGRQFYNKYGFRVLEETPHEVVMGIRV